MPKEIYLGVPRRKVTLRNLVTDGSFEGSGWRTSDTTWSTDAYHGSRSLSIAAGASGFVDRAIENPVVGHQYYGREYITASGDIGGGTDGRFEYFGSDDNKITFAGHMGGWCNWKIYSGVGSFTTAPTSCVIRTFKLGPLCDMLIDGIMIIDLTEAFGAGNEPTKEWCDANIPFFEGEHLLEYVAGENTVTNLMMERAFLDGGTYTNAALYHGPNSAKVRYTKGNKVYTRAKISCTGGHIRAGARYWDNTGAFLWQAFADVVDGYASVIGSMDNSAVIEMDFAVQNVSDEVVTEIQYSKCLWIDLTACFGAGNEPTKEWCDANIPFFEGSYSFGHTAQNGVARKTKAIYLGVDGIARKVTKAYIGVSGVARLCYQSSIPLSELPEGALIRLYENGVGANFYLSKHDYESGLNGAGRSLLVRETCYDSRAWDAGNSNAYASSDIDAWLNGTYKNLLDASVRNAISTTTFYYTIGGGDTTVSTLSRSVFLLSVTELGRSSTYANVEGSRLPNYMTLYMAYLNGSRTNQHTRTPYKDNSWTVLPIERFASVTTYNASDAFGSRPAFTLPSSAGVIPTPNADGSYTLSV